MRPQAFPIWPDPPAALCAVVPSGCLIRKGTAGGCNLVVIHRAKGQRSLGFSAVLAEGQLPAALVARIRQI